MDSQTAPRVPTNGHVESPNLERIKAAFRTSADEGFIAGLEALLEMAHEDCEFRPYLADGSALRGHDDIRAFYRRAAAEGSEMKLRATSFDESGDQVLVNGSVRVARPTGGFLESQLSWTYTFRDGLLAEVVSGPRRT
jgi:ketosteroid isomerase-like protein